MIHRHNKCIGFTLFRFGKRQIELWYCPKGEFIEPHAHPNINSTLVILGGRVQGDIDGIGGIVGWNDLFRRFRIPAGTIHSAKVTGSFFLFMNYEKFTGEGKPASASEDFMPLPELAAHSNARAMLKVLKLPK